MLELEDADEDERKELHGKIESLESIVRMLELKSKNSSDHGIVPVAVYVVSVISLIPPPKIVKNYKYTCF